MSAARPPEGAPYRSAQREGTPVSASATIRLIAAQAASERLAGTNVLELANDADPLAAPLEGVDRVELHFPKFSDGRAFSQAVLLRQRRGYTGDIRATGEVLVDQLVQMQRCGFSSAVLHEGEDPAVALRQLVRYAGWYQQDPGRAAP